MNIIIDIGAWSKDTVLKQLGNLFGFDSYTVNMTDQSITIHPTAIRARGYVQPELDLRPMAVAPKPAPKGMSQIGTFTTPPKVATEASRKIEVKQPAKIESSTKRAEMVCPECGKKFIPFRYNQKFCCPACQQRAKHHHQNNVKRERRAVAKLTDVEDGGRVVTTAKAVVTAPAPAPVVNVQKKIDEPPKTVNKERFERKCELCGSTFLTSNPHEHFCSQCHSSFSDEECIALANEEKMKKLAIEEAAKIKFKVCPRCGNTFEAKNPAKEFFCPKCVARAMNLPKIEKKEGEE